jgi:glycosyltransferase involved in cell wall biosynthesis
MKIGHYMPGVWDQGGIASYLRRVTAAQRDAGHTIQFFDSRPQYADFDNLVHRPLIVKPHELAGRAMAEGVDVLHLHSTIDPLPAVGKMPMFRTVHEHRPYCPSGERYLLQRGAPCDRLYSLAGCLRGHYLDRCGSRHPGRAIRGFVAARHERRTLPNLSVIAISRFVRDQMVRNGYDGSRIRIVHNPAPKAAPQGPPPIEGVPRFLFLGRIVSHKGLRWLLESMAEVRVPIALDVAGEGGERAAMESLARDLGLGESVKFHGWIDEPAIDVLAASARAIVFAPIWHEPAGLACMDGSARGRAVIASQSGGLPEYAIGGENALVVPINDRPALAAALTTLAQDWALAAALGETGLRMARGAFSLERHIQALDEIYRECAS